MPGKTGRLKVKTNTMAENSVDFSDGDEEPVLRREAVAGTRNMAVASLESQLRVVELSKGKTAMKKYREESR